MRRTILFAAAALVCIVFVVGASTAPTAKAVTNTSTVSTTLSVPASPATPTTDDNFPLNYVPSGRAIFQQYCASCHGALAKGDGPMAAVLKKMPPDLTQLSRRHQGKFPEEYVRAVLEFGPGPSAHGSADMPSWGPIFRYYDKQNERVVQQRIRNLTNYLASLQE
jgi:mono/diheme cytochrome c family protein